MDEGRDNISVGVCVFFFYLIYKREKFFDCLQAIFERFFVGVLSVRMVSRTLK